MDFIHIKTMTDKISLFSLFCYYPIGISSRTGASVPATLDPRATYARDHYEIIAAGCRHSLDEEELLKSQT